MSGNRAASQGRSDDKTVSMMIALAMSGLVDAMTGDRAIDRIWRIVIRFLRRAVKQMSRRNSLSFRARTSAGRDADRGDYQGEEARFRPLRPWTAIGRMRGMTAAPCLEVSALARQFRANQIEPCFGTP